MPDVAALIQGSTAHAWLYLPFAVVIGALHALEPGHAKFLMAGYTVDQAEPWLTTLSGILIVLLAIRMMGALRGHHHHGHDHDHGHSQAPN